MPIDYTKRPSQPDPPPPPPPSGPPSDPQQGGGWPPPAAAVAGDPAARTGAAGLPAAAPARLPAGRPAAAGVPAAPAAAGTGAAAAAAAAGRRAVSLSKVTLTKNAPTVSLTKHGGNSGVMRINLNWNARPPAKGLFKKNTQLDLDLGCLYEFADGTKGVVQALGNAFRARPRTGGQDLIWLDGDDRSGASTEGENLHINLDGLAQIRRVLVFALIYEGAANWAEAQGVTTLFPVNAAPIEIRLDDPRDGARICAIALLTNDNGAADRPSRDQLPQRGPAPARRGLRVGHELDCRAQVTRVLG